MTIEDQPITKSIGKVSQSNGTRSIGHTLVGGTLETPTHTLHLTEVLQIVTGGGLVIDKSLGIKLRAIGIKGNGCLSM